MVAESAHSLADTGNQIFLLAANRRSDDTKSAVAHRLRALERELENDPLIADALLTVADSDFEDET